MDHTARQEGGLPASPQNQTAPAKPSTRQRNHPTSAYPEPMDRLITELAKMPGVGRRSAERLAFFLLKAQRNDALALAAAVRDVKDHVRHCRYCYNLSDTDVCTVCADERRDRTRILVIEQPKDLIAFEQAGSYRGLYHVLMGRLSPLEHIGPETLTIEALLDRARHPATNPGKAPVEEIILGLNPTVEGDGTALYLRDVLEDAAVRVTRLARGLPTGSQLEYVNKAVLADALEGRVGM